MSHRSRHDAGSRAERDASRSYDRARDAFDDLDREDQARFLAETTVSAVARGVKTVSRALADELESFFGRPRSSEPGSSPAKSSPRDPSRNGPGPAEPPTDAQERNG